MSRFYWSLIDFRCLCLVEINPIVGCYLQSGTIMVPRQSYYPNHTIPPKYPTIIHLGLQKYLISFLSFFENDPLSFSWYSNEDVVWSIFSGDWKVPAGGSWGNLSDNHSSSVLFTYNVHNRTIFQIKIIIKSVSNLELHPGWALEQLLVQHRKGILWKFIQ